MATVTMSDVARAAGVSIMTVSNVINERPRVSADTRARVLAVVADLGYEVNLSAKRLRAGRAGTVALVVPRFDHPYFGELAARYVEAFGAHGIHVAVEQSGASREGELSAVSRARLQMYDGVLLSVVGQSYDDVDRLHAQVPIVLLGEQEMPRHFDHVMLANIEGAELATGALLDSGRTAVAIVGGNAAATDMGMARLRTDGWRRAHAERGVVADERLVIELPQQEMSEARRQVAGALERGLRFDALFAITDQDAVGAMAALHDAGLSIPGDVAVVGFDNLVLGEHLRPSLTTIDPSNDWVVEQSTRLLRSRMSGDDSAPEHLTAPVRLVERASTGG
ncbi:LacI family DNA-binding transcriptional regulator [Microbacterium sp. NPDC055903]